LHFSSISKIWQIIVFSGIDKKIVALIKIQLWYCFEIAFHASGREICRDMGEMYAE
jgi:hypothetical protein